MLTRRALFFAPLAAVFVWGRAASPQPSLTRWYMHPDRAGVFVDRVTGREVSWHMLYQTLYHADGASALNLTQVLRLFE